MAQQPEMQEQMAQMASVMQNKQLMERMQDLRVSRGACHLCLHYTVSHKFLTEKQPSVEHHLFDGRLVQSRAVYLTHCCPRRHESCSSGSEPTNQRVGCMQPTAPKGPGSHLLLHA